jgi:hypothetical protein
MPRYKKKQTKDDGDDENQANYSSQDHDDEFEDGMIDGDEQQDDDDEGEEEEEEEENFQVFAGQSEVERRAIRRQQRALQKKLEDGDGVEVEDARGQNNKIFKKVKFTREAALDGDNMNIIATKASQKMDRLVQVGH